MTYFFNKKWSKKANFLKPTVIKRRAWKTLNIVSTLAIVLNTGLIGGLIKPTVAQATTTWDKSSLSFNSSYGCHGSCTEVKAKICNVGDHDMQGTSTYEVYYSPSGNPQSGTVVASGTINALDEGHCQFLTYNPNNIEGNYKFKAYQRPGHPGTGSLWSNTCEVNRCVQPGSISGYKFEDKNGNGAWDEGEPTLKDWKIFIDQNANGSWDTGEPFMMTGNDGKYEFTNLMPGDYAVLEVHQSFWLQTKAPSNPVHVVSNTDTSDQNFGNFKKARIAGNKFNDLNGNSVWDKPNEPALSGWTIKATKGDAVKTVVTDSNGQYLFPPFLPEDVGTWVISEVQQDGWIQTFPAEKTYSIVVESGTNVSHKDFGNHLGQCELTILKYVDKESAKPGDTLTYTIKYENVGTAVCTGTGVKVFDQLNSNLSYVKDSKNITITNDGEGDGYDPVQGNDYNGHGKDLLFNVRRVSPGEKGEISFSAKIDTETACNVTNIPNTAKIWSNQTGYIESNQVNTSLTFNLDDNNVCTSDRCNPETGEIEHTTINYDDNNACTIDSCDPVEGVSHSPVNVDDQNACTVDSCNEKTGEITHDPVNTNDDNACTVDQCNVETGEITHTPVNIDDQNVCTVDQCDQETGEITHTALNTDDGNACTIDSCDPIEGVLHEPKDIDDHNACTTDSCNSETGEISNVPVNTDDGNICTDDSCNQETGIISHDYNENICPLPGKISGHKYNWSNEQGLDNWEICLSKISMVPDLALFDTLRVFRVEPEEICVLTGDPGKEWSKGYYEFGNLTPGTYKVWEKLQYGWTQMDPNDPNYFTILISSGTNSQGNNFWNRQNEFNVTMTKTVDKELVEAGDNLTYQLKWTLTGNTSAQVKIFDALPANTTFVSATDGGSLDGSTVKWDLGTRTPAAEGFVYFTVKVNTPYPETAEKIISNTAQVCGYGEIIDGTPLNSENNLIRYKCADGSITTSVHAAPKIDLIKTADPLLVGGNQNVTYTITWSVAGNSQATAVKITETPMPINTAYVSSSCGTTTGTCSISATGSPVNSVIWDLGNRLPGETGTVQLVVKTDISVPNGTVIPNTAKISAESIDPVFAAADVKTATAPTLQITKTINATYINPGDPVTYTVKVKNIGTDIAKNVTLTDTLPTGFTFVDGGGSTKTFILGDMAVGAEITTTYVVISSHDTTAGFYDNLAKAKADNAAEVSTKATVEVRIPKVLGEETKPVLQIRKTVDKSTAAPGDKLTYTVEIKNTGSGSAINVELQDILPSGFTFNGTKDTTKSWKLGELKAGETTKVTYKVQVSLSMPAGDFENLAIATADNHGKVTASVPVNVKRGRVLGETLPETGAGMTDVGIAAFGLATIVLGYTLIRRRGKAESYN